MMLNADICKELTVDFKNNQWLIDPVQVDGKELSKVQRAKISGVMISTDLKWNKHVYEVI